MPFIHIKSLPLKSGYNMAEIVTAIARDFADENNLPPEHIHATWEYFSPGHYARGGTAPAQHTSSSHSVIVDLLTPDFNSIDTIRRMLLTLARSISSRADIDEKGIFINHRNAHSGQVFDEGKIALW